MTNKREYTCPYCGGKSRQPTMCDYCSAKRKIIRADRDLEEGEKVMFDDLVDWLQEYGKLNAIDECKYAANVIKGLYFGRENLRERLEISPYGEDKIDRLEAEIKNLSQELERVKQEPSVDPHKHGRWERCFEDWRRQIEGSKCTACGFEHYGSCINYYHYCPNCGTRMDGGEEQ